MAASDPTHPPTRLDAAAAAMATAALAPHDPVLLFRPTDLRQIGAHEADSELGEARGAIAVSPPQWHEDDHHLANLCARQLSKAIVRSGLPNRLGQGMSPMSVLVAVSALVDAARRRGHPRPWVALGGDDLREIDLGVVDPADAQLLAGLLWVRLPGLGGSWTKATATARARIEAALAGTCPGPWASLPAVRPASPPSGDDPQRAA